MAVNEQGARIVSTAAALEAVATENQWRGQRILVLEEDKVELMAVIAAKNAEIDRLTQVLIENQINPHPGEIVAPANGKAAKQAVN